MNVTRNLQARLALVATVAATMMVTGTAGATASPEAVADESDGLVLVASGVPVPSEDSEPGTVTPFYIWDVGNCTTNSSYYKVYYYKHFDSKKYVDCYAGTGSMSGITNDARQLHEACPGTHRGHVRIFDKSAVKWTWAPIRNGKSNPGQCYPFGWKAEKYNAVALYAN